jgi:hypothetical protein
MQMFADDAEVQQLPQSVGNVVYKSQMHSEGKDWGLIQAKLFTDTHLNKENVVNKKRFSCSRLNNTALNRKNKS